MSEGGFIGRLWLYTLIVVLITIVAGALLTVAGVELDIWRTDKEREFFDRSSPAIDGHVHQLGIHMADYNRLEAEADTIENLELLRVNEASRAGSIQLMWQHYDAIPEDLREEQVPSDIRQFMDEHPRGSN